MSQKLSDHPEEDVIQEIKSSLFVKTNICFAEFCLPIIQTNDLTHQNVFQ